MGFDPQPTLVGPTLRLRPLTAMGHDEFDRFFDDSLASGGGLIVETRNGVVIGFSRYQDYDDRSASVEIGWSFLSRSYSGGATNRAMKVLMLEHAFTAVDEVYFYIAPRNLRSRRAVEKLGGQRTGATARPGMVTYVMSRQNWDQCQHIAKAQ